MYDPWTGVQVILTLAPLAIVSWIALLYLCFVIFGISPRRMLNEITLPEAVVVVGLAYSASTLMAAVYSKFT